MNDEGWRKVQRWSGWLAILCLIATVISGFAWDIRTSDFIRKLTGGLLSRTLGADLHTYLIVPLTLVLLLHFAPNIRKRFKNKHA